MPRGSIDRRVTRTRSLLQRALLKLTAEKGYEAATVEDICRQANIGRSTFYTHYRDKESLRKATIDQHMKGLVTQRADRESVQNAARFSFSGQALEHAYATRGMHGAFLGGKKREIPQEVREWIGKEIRRELIDIAQSNKDEATLDFATRFVTGAFFEVVTWWLDGNANLPPQEIDRLFQKLAVDGVSVALGGPKEEGDQDQVVVREG